VLRDIFKIFSNTETLKWCGIGCGSRFASTNKKFAMDNLPTPMQDDMKNANSLFSLACLVVKHRASSMSHYCDAPPFLFAQLLSPLEERVNAGLAQAKEAWEAMCFAEAKCHTCPDLADLMQQIPYFNLTVVREVLLHLAQLEFKMVHPAAIAILKPMFQGWGQSGVVERAFNPTRDMQRESKNQRMARLKRWMCAVDAKVIAEHGREEVTADTERAALKKVSPSMFDFRDSQPTVPAQVLNQICGRIKWQTYTPQSYHTCVSAWQLLLHAFRTHTIEKVGQAWRTAFLLQGSVVIRKLAGPGAAMLVLKSTQYAMLCWPLAAWDEQGRTFFQVDTRSGSKPSWHVAYEFDEWRVLPHEVVPPSVMKAVYKVGSHHGVCMRQAGAALGVVHAAALAGFKGLSTSMLQDLATDMMWDVSGMPTHHCELLDWLIRKAVPDIGDAEVAKVFEGSAAPDQSVLLLGDHQELADGVLAAQDKLDCKSHGHALEQAKLRRQEVAHYMKGKSYEIKGSLQLELPREAAPRPRGRPKSAASSSSMFNFKADPNTWTDPYLKTLLPQVVGCHITVVPTRQTATAYYRTLEPPSSRSRTWGTRHTPEQVLAHVVSWAWMQHAAQTGEKCPHDLEKLLV
jgi:hypothetical protein